MATYELIYECFRKTFCQRVFSLTLSLQFKWNNFKNTIIIWEFSRVPSTQKYKWDHFFYDLELKINCPHKHTYHEIRNRFLLLFFVVVIAVFLPLSFTHTHTVCAYTHMRIFFSILFSCISYILLIFSTWPQSTIHHNLFFALTSNTHFIPIAFKTETFDYTK